MSAVAAICHDCGVGLCQEHAVESPHQLTRIVTLNRPLPVSVGARCGTGTNEAEIPAFAKGPSSSATRVLISMFSSVAQLPIRSLASLDPFLIPASAIQEALFFSPLARRDPFLFVPCPLRKAVRLVAFAPLLRCDALLLASVAIGETLLFGPLVSGNAFSFAPGLLC